MVQILKVYVIQMGFGCIIYLDQIIPLNYGIAKRGAYQTLRCEKLSSSRILRECIKSTAPGFRYGNSA